MTPNTPLKLSAQEITQNLKTFCPASSEARSLPLLTLMSAERFPHALNELYNNFYPLPEITNIDNFNSEAKFAKKLKELFDFHKSDKGTNKYHLIYGEILTQLGIDTPLNILEIGLGSHNKAIAPHMEPSFTPGGSIKTFRDALKNSQIYGADIDQDILFSEERIKTAYVNQMNPESFWQMNSLFGNIFYDLIIDDGLHSPPANLNTLLFAIGVLKVGGWFVIEDIWTGQVCWDIVYRIIPADKFRKYIISYPNEKRVFILQKL